MWNGGNVYSRQSNQQWASVSWPSGLSSSTRENQFWGHHFWVQTPLSQTYAAALSCPSEYSCVVIDVSDIAMLSIWTSKWQCFSELVRKVSRLWLVILPQQKLMLHIVTCAILIGDYVNVCHTLIWQCGLIFYWVLLYANGLCCLLQYSEVSPWNWWGPEPWQGWGPMVDLKFVPLQYYHWVPMVMALLALFWSVKHPTGRLANIHNESTILSHVGFMWLALILECSILNHNVYFLYCYVSAVDLGEWLCLFRACTRLMDTGPLSQALRGQHVASPFGCAGF